MLVGLSFKKTDSTDYMKDYGVAVAKSLGTKTRVLEPKNIEEYLDVLKAYTPSSRESVVFLSTHLDTSGLSSGKWRATDTTFNQKGGVLFGDLPKRASTSHRGIMPGEDDIDHIAKAAHYYSDRAKYIKGTIRDYVGRADSDPHTLILGFTPSWPRLSVTAEALLAGLPDGGDDAPWWWGVAFFNRRNKTSATAEEVYQALLDEFPYASRVVVSDAAQQAMDALEEPYQRAGEVRFKTLPEGERFGKELRRLTRLDSERVVE